MGSDIAELFIANSLEHYIELAVNIAKQENIEKYNLKKTICSRRENLFGSKVLEEVSNEWSSWLHSIKRNL